MTELDLVIELFNNAIDDLTGGELNEEVEAMRKALNIKKGSGLDLLACGYLMGVNTGINILETIRQRGERKAST